MEWWTGPSLNVIVFIHFEYNCIFINTFWTADSDIPCKQSLWLWCYQCEKDDIAHRDRGISMTMMMMMMMTMTMMMMMIRVRRVISPTFCHLITRYLARWHIFSKMCSYVWKSKSYCLAIPWKKSKGCVVCNPWGYASILLWHQHQVGPII